VRFSKSSSRTAWVKKTLVIASLTLRQQQKTLSHENQITYGIVMIWRALNSEV
jgi:hypothetical protein